MEAYKPYLDYLLNGGVCETAYILSRQGAICTTNLPIKELPSYNFKLEDEKDPNITHDVVVNECAILLDAIANKGVPKSKTGIRLYNQKYYTVRTDEAGEVIYLKKVVSVVNAGKRRSVYCYYQELHRNWHLQLRTQDVQRCASESWRAQQTCRGTRRRAQEVRQLIQSDCRRFNW